MTFQGVTLNGKNTQNYFLYSKEIYSWVLIVIYMVDPKKNVLEKDSFFSMIYISFLFESFILKDYWCSYVERLEPTWNKLEGMLKLYTMQRRI